MHGRQKKDLRTPEKLKAAEAHIHTRRMKLTRKVRERLMDSQSDLLVTIVSVLIEKCGTIGNGFGISILPFPQVYTARDRETTGFDATLRCLVGRDRAIAIFTGSFWTGSGYNNLLGISLNESKISTIAPDRGVVPSPVISRGEKSEDCSVFFNGFFAYKIG